MIKVGIECENLEDPKSRWGVGQMTFNLLKEYSDNLELQKKYKLYLYFKKIIPADDFLKNPVFVKRILGSPSFNIFYHILMPIRAMLDRLDWMFFPAYMLPPLYFGKSIVTLTDDVYIEYKYGALPFRYRLAYGLFTNWAAWRAKKIMAISKKSGDEVAKLYPISRERIFVNYLGVDVLRSDSIRKDPGDYFLYVGQMFPRRHARETILAFERVANKVVGSKMIMVGPDKYPNHVIDPLIEKTNLDLGYNAIIHRDRVSHEELVELYLGAISVVYVSDREAFGLPPVEALSLGRPSIVMDNELGREIFGPYAFYAKDGGVDNIARAMLDSLNDSTKIDRIRTEGAEFSQRYNWKTFTKIFFSSLT